MNFDLNQKKISSVQDKRGRALCSKKTQTVRICTDNKCAANQNRNMCSSVKCDCNTNLHKYCTQFINFECFNTIVEGFQKNSYLDLMNGLLEDLQTIVQKTVKLYNFIVDKLDTYMMPEPIQKAKASISTNSSIPKVEPLGLKGFFDKYKTEFDIPDLKNQPTYMRDVTQAKETMSACKKAFNDFCKKISNNINEHNEKSNKLIIQKNDAQLEQRKKQESIQKSRPQYQ